MYFVVDLQGPASGTFSGTVQANPLCAHDCSSCHVLLRLAFMRALVVVAASPGSAQFRNQLVLAPELLLLAKLASMRIQYTTATIIS